ncbi:WD40 repeat protein [Pseudomonas syringae pv. actinidiae]|uniref:WD40 repeat protein n=1 Tax=Pseudomonas syringae pv. actinidiae TaxID=103796 RepID=A0AAN4QDL5_PSESF|nr:WD40 repeat protein [Pseudomonas syringae pv. actinidiae]
MLNRSAECCNQGKHCDSTGISSSIDRGDSPGITTGTGLGDATDIPFSIDQGDSRGITTGTGLGDATGITFSADQGDSRGITSSTALSHSTRKPTKIRVSAKKPFRSRNGLLLTLSYTRRQSCLALSIISYKGSAQHG